MRYLFLYLICFISFVKFSKAQSDNQYVPDHKGSWRNTIITNERITPFKVTAEEKKSLLQKADAATQLIKSFAHFNPPMGMDMFATSGMKFMDDEAIRKIKPNTPLPLEIVVSLADYINQNGKLVVITRPELHATIKLFFNNIEAAFDKYELFYGGLHDQYGTQYYYEPFIHKTFENVTLYSNQRVLFTKSGKPLWIPVTAKQYLEAQLYYNEQKIKNGSTDLQLVYDNVKKELKEMAAEDLNKPAYYSSQFVSNLSQLSLEKTATTSAIVKLNPEYFDKGKPRTAAQLLVVELGFAAYDFSEPIATEDDRFGNNEKQLYKFFSKFDFSKLKSLLD